MRGFLWALAWIVTAVVGLFGFALIGLAAEWGTNFRLGVFLVVIAGFGAIVLLTNLPKDHWPE